MNTKTLASLVSCAAIALVELFVSIPSAHAQTQTLPDLIFGTFITPEGGQLPGISYNPPIPHAQEGFQIQWVDFNWTLTPIGAYNDLVWITDDRNNNVVVWSQEISLAGLGPWESASRVVEVPPGTIAPGKYTLHVRINSRYLPELDFFYNETSNGGIDVGQ